MAGGSSGVLVEITGGPTVTVPWSASMNAQDALERAYDQINSSEKFTFALQYYSKLGYMVVMINETYDTFVSSSKPFFYWEFLVNGKPSDIGIDGKQLKAGDKITFSYLTFDPDIHKSVLMRAKYEQQTKKVKP